MSLIQKRAADAQARHGLWLLALLFLLMHLSGDHLFDKTNTLKMVVLALSCTVLLLYQLFYRSYTNDAGGRVLLFLLLPMLATLPGWLFSGGRYDYAAPYELAGTLLCVLWGWWVFCLLDDWSVKRLAWGLIPTIMFVCLIGVLEKVGYDPLIRLGLNPFEAAAFKDSLVYQGTAERVMSTFGNINYFAAFLILLIPVVLALFVGVWQSESRGGRRWWFLLLFVLLNLLLMMVLLQFTGTRAAVAALVIALAAFALLYAAVVKRVSLARVLILVPILLLLVAAMFFTDSSLAERFAALAGREAWLSRFVGWQAAWLSISDAPWFGYGIGSSYQLFFDYVDPESRLQVWARSFNHVHFEMLEVLQEGGIFGLLFYLLFWGALFVGAIRLVFDQKVDVDVRVIALGLLCGLLAYHLHGMFSVAPRMVAVKVTAYTLAAALLILLNRHAMLPFLFNDGMGRRPLLAVAAFVLVAVWSWLLPYANTHRQMAEVLVNGDNASLYALAAETDDVYVLDAAAKQAARARDGAHLSDLAARLGQIFPGYRNVEFYSAYGHYLAGDTAQSLGYALAAQARDRYHPETGLLLVKLAYHTQDEALFRQQLALALKAYGCRNHVIDCERVAVEVELVDAAEPALLEMNKAQLVLRINRNFWNFLVEQYRRSRSGGSFTSAEHVPKFAALIGKGRFFLPSRLPDSEPPEDLTEFLQLNNRLENRERSFDNAYRVALAEAGGFWSQRRIYQRQEAKFQSEYQLVEKNQARLEERLSKALDLKQFMRRRALLIDLSTWLVKGVSPDPF